MKQCTKCELDKDESEFHVYTVHDKHKTGGLHSKCKACEHAARDKHRRRNPLLVAIVARRCKLKRLYGITPEDYDNIFTSQGGVCAICARVSPDGRRLHVDHCHESNTVRGLLCHDCNRGLGIFRDNEEILQKAIKYLALSRGRDTVST